MKMKRIKFLIISFVLLYSSIIYVNAVYNDNFDRALNIELNSSASFYSSQLGAYDSCYYKFEIPI